jgi:hypothetical protein
MDSLAGGPIGNVFRFALNAQACIFRAVGHIPGKLAFFRYEICPIF